MVWEGVGVVGVLRRVPSPHTADTSVHLQLLYSAHRALPRNNYEES
jgi:hypothetical protein